MGQKEIQFAVVTVGSYFFGNEWTNVNVDDISLVKELSCPRPMQCKHAEYYNVRAYGG